MFFSAEDDDDGSGFSVGMPTSGSKLGSLFGDRPSQSGNESLMYTAPKQPKQKGEETKPSADAKTDAPSLLYACACHTFKYLNGQFMSQGKLGSAVLGHLAAKDYKILLYMSQKKPVTNAKIHAKFQFNVQKNNYVSFYDDQSQSWSLCFDTDVQLAEFSKWIALSRYNVQGNTLVTQDLNVMEGQEIQKGDTVEMQYTGWLHAGNAFGKVFDSNKESGKLFKFKVGKGKVIKGWDMGVIGMKKGSKRILVIPPDLAYGTKAVGDRVPANSTLIFQVEVTRVKFANPKPDSDSISVMSMEVAPKDEAVKLIKSETSEDVDQVDVDGRQRANSSDSLKERTKSISDQLAKSPENSKSKLLERMSKMGHSLVPTQTGSKSISSELTEEVQEETGHHQSQPQQIKRQHSKEHSQTGVTPGSPKPNVRPKPEPILRASPSVSSPLPNTTYSTPSAAPMSQPVHQMPFGQQGMYQAAFENNPMFQQQHSQQMALYQSPQAIQSTMFGIAGLQQPIQAQQQSGMTSTEINLMMTDGRLKHTEVKSDLTRLLEKVDAMSLKLNALEGLNRQVQPFQQQSLVMDNAQDMEAGVLMHNITRILKENEKLRVDCEEKNKKIEKLNERMSDLLTKNQQFFERSNELIANQTDSLQTNATQAMAKVSTLEQQNIKLDTELSTSKTQLLHAQSKLEAAVKKEMDLVTDLEARKLEIKQLKASAESATSTSSEHEIALEELKSKQKTDRKEQKELKLKYEQIEEELLELKVEKESFIKNVNDLKKKRKDDAIKHDEELDEMKNQHEEELKSLKQRFKKNAGNENEKLTQLEEELKEKHEKNLNLALKKLGDKHITIANELKDEKNTLQGKLKETEQKITTISEQISSDYEKRMNEATESIKLSNDDTIEEMKNEMAATVAELTQAQNTIRNLSSNDSSSQSKLELDEMSKKISSLETENLQLNDELRGLKTSLEEAMAKASDSETTIEKLTTECDEAYDKGIEEGRSTVKTISSASYKKGYDEGKASVEETTESASPNKEKINEEVKKVMNGVFFRLRSEFVPVDTYNGKEVVGTMLDIIKEVTLRMTQDSEEQGEETESEEEEEEEDDDEEELSEESEGEDEVDEDNTESTTNVVASVDLPSSDDTDGTASILQTASDVDKVKNQPTEEEKNEYEIEAKFNVDVVSKSVPIPIETSTNSENAMEGKCTQKEINREIRSPLNDSDDEFVTDEGESEDERNNVDDIPATHEISVENHEGSKVIIPPESSANSASAKDVLGPAAKSLESIPSTSSTLEDSKSPLEQVGLDSSIFGEVVTDDTEEVKEKPEKNNLEDKTAGDESSLFFSSSTQEKEQPTAKAAEKTTNDQKKPSLFFGEDEEDDDFFKPKGTTKVSAFDRSPPPLFEDDDDDTNWI